MSLLGVRASPHLSPFRGSRNKYTQGIAPNYTGKNTNTTHFVQKCFPQLSTINDKPLDPPCVGTSKFHMQLKEGCETVEPKQNTSVTNCNSFSKPSTPRISSPKPANAAAVVCSRRRSLFTEPALEPKIRAHSSNSKPKKAIRFPITGHSRPATANPLPNHSSSIKLVSHSKPGLPPSNQKYECSSVFPPQDPPESEHNIIQEIRDATARMRQNVNNFTQLESQPVSPPVQSPSFSSVEALSDFNIDRKDIEDPCQIKNIINRINKHTQSQLQEDLHLTELLSRIPKTETESGIVDLIRSKGQFVHGRAQAEKEALNNQQERLRMLLEALYKEYVRLCKQQKDGSAVSISRTCMQDSRLGNQQSGAECECESERSSINTEKLAVIVAVLQTKLYEQTEAIQMGAHVQLCRERVSDLVKVIGELEENYARQKLKISLMEDERDELILQIEDYKRCFGHETSNLLEQREKHMRDIWSNKLAASSEQFDNNLARTEEEHAIIVEALEEERDAYKDECESLLEQNKRLQDNLVTLYQRTSADPSAIDACLYCPKLVSSLSEVVASIWKGIEVVNPTPVHIEDDEELNYMDEEAIRERVTDLVSI